MTLISSTFAPVSPLLQSPDDPEEQTRYEMVTPEVAKDLLENHNPYNRPVSRTNVNFFVQAMERDVFDPRTVVLLLDKEGNLLDVQHRLIAQVQVGKTYTYLVRRGVDHSLMESIDRGRLRTQSETIFLRGAVSSAVDAGAVSSVVNAINRYTNGARGQDTFVSPRDRGRLTHTEAADFYEGHQFDVDQAIAWSRMVPTSVVSSAARKVSALAYYLFSGKNEADANEFFNKLINGTTEKDGVLHLLRETLSDKTNLRAGKKMGASRYAAVVFYLLSRAWEAYRKGETLQRFSIPTVFVAERFPELV